jgi:protein tyrosine/serine phosphatase
VINFRPEPDSIQWEKEKVEALGMKFVSLPWNITESVEPQLLDQFFEILDEPMNRPVFFHCKHGRDRTGVMSTLALMRYEKLSEAQARELALETIHPNLQYRFSVNRKIDFFVKERPQHFSDSSSS